MSGERAGAGRAPSPRLLFREGLIVSVGLALLPVLAMTMVRLAMLVGLAAP